MELIQNYSFFEKTKLDNFIGEWVAICNQKIVAHGKKLDKVLEETKKICPKVKPLIVRVPEEDTMIF